MKRFSKNLSAALAAMMLFSSVLPFGDPSFAESDMMKNIQRNHIDKESYKTQVAEEVKASKSELIIYVEEGRLGECSQFLKSQFSGQITSKKQVGNYVIIQLEDPSKSAEIILKLKKCPYIKEVSPNYPLKAYSAETGNGENLTGTSKNTTNASQEETTNTQETKAVLVGVLDSGVDLNHRDLALNIYKNPFEIPNNLVDDDGNGYIDDVNGWDFFNNDNTVYDEFADETHGTQVAGLIAKQAGMINSEGKSNAVIVPLKFMNGKEGYTSDAIAAIEYAKKLGVRVINASFGSSENNVALKAAMKDSGILFITAAGNKGQNLDENPVYPASYELSNVLTVGAMGQEGTLANYSNYGKAVDMIATGNFTRTLAPNNKYLLAQGSSYSAASVTGIAIRILGTRNEIDAETLRKLILDQTTVSESLKDQIPSGRFLNARNLNSEGEYVNTENQNSGTYSQNRATGTETSQGVEGNSKVNAFGLNVSAKLIEAIHFGEPGVNAATGNYSNAYTDLSVDSPGFDVNFTRTYNSKDDRSVQSMGRGWTFGFEGSIKPDTDNAELMVAKLPNGKVQVFKKTPSNTFEAYDSRSKLVSTGANNYTLTTPDQYSYEYTNTFLTAMVDRSGNRLTIEIKDALGHVSKVTDASGRVYDIKYTDDRISKIVLPENREINFSYTNGQLTEVKGLAGQSRKYTYDGQARLTSVLDSYGNVVESVIYEVSTETNRVTQFTNSQRKVSTYAFPGGNKTVVTDNGGRKFEITYDTDKYTINTLITDAAGKSLSEATTYFLDPEGRNRFGDVKTTKDIYGNVTEYVRDANGNVVKTINPDKSTKTFAYDSSNNLIEQVSETGKRKFFVYDDSQQLLLKEVRPFDGTSSYSDSSDRSKYEIVEYRYYNEVEKERLGIKINGLIKEKIDPNGNVFRYTYDNQGNQSKVIDPEGMVTEYFYNSIGWLMKTKKQDGSEVDYTYDPAGHLVKQTETYESTTKVTRMLYDFEGRVLLSVEPKAYKPEFDQVTPSNGGDYTSKVENTVYSYDSAGNLKEKVMPDGGKYLYEYDIYGNKTKETLPNGTSYIYSYDFIDRPLDRVFYKNITDLANSKGIMLESVSYPTPTEDQVKKGIHEKKVKQWLNQEVYKDVNGAAEETTLFTTYTLVSDYSGREIKQKRQDGSELTNTYTKDGLLQSSTDYNGATKHYVYDGLGRPAEIWLPIEDGLYSYTSYKYDPNGNTIEEARSIDLVRLHYKSDNDQKRIERRVYNRNNQVTKKEVLNGAVTEYKYDEVGRLVSELTKVDSKNTRKTTYEYNGFGEKVATNQYVNGSELKVGTINKSGEVKLSEKYVLDKNGNVTQIAKADGQKIYCEYDNMNRPVLTRTKLTNANGDLVDGTKKIKYDLMGNVVEQTELNGKTTKFYYNKLNQRIGEVQQLETLVNGVSTLQNVAKLYKYDLAGNVITSISPANVKVENLDLNNIEAYDFSTSKRSEFRYNENGNKYLSKDIYLDKADSKLKELVVYAAAFDKNGNVTKEVTGEAWKNAAGGSFDERLKKAYGTTYTYTPDNQVKTIRTPEAQKNSKNYAVKINYDGFGRKTEEIDAYGQVSTTYYDVNSNVTAQGKRKSTQEPEVILGKNLYNLVGQVVESVDGNGNSTKYTYGKSGWLLSVTEPQVAESDLYVKEYLYNLSGKPVVQSDTNGKETILTYNQQEQVIKQVIRSENAKKEYLQEMSYDLVGNKVSETSPNGDTSKYQYDTLNRLVAVQKSDKEKTKTVTLVKYQYDLNNNKLSETDRFGNTLVFSYDDFNRLTEKKDALGKVIEQLSYDADHKQTLSVDALGNAVKYKYDLDGRLIAQSRRAPVAETADDSKLYWKKSAYDLKGRLTSTKDELGNTTQFVFDELDRLTEVINALDEHTSYSYDLNGNMISQTDGNGNTTTLKYNAKNQVVKRIDPSGVTVKNGKEIFNDAMTVNYEYNPNGTVKSTKDRNGNIFVYSYDLLDRTIKTTSGSETIQQAFDGNGNLTISKNNSEEVIRSYDFMNRTVQKSHAKLGSSSFEYDITAGLTPGENKEVTIDLQGNVFEKVFDQNGRLSKVIDGADTASYEYADNGALLRLNYPGTIQQKFEYNPDLTLKKVSNTAGSSVINTFDYTYDPCGNMLTKTDSKGTTKYTYDALSRLKTVTEPSGKNVEYEYDKAGNRVREVIEDKGTLTVKKYKYNPQNRLMEVVNVDMGTGKEESLKYIYDNNGNQLYTNMEHTQKADPAAKPSFGMYISGESYSGESAKVFFEANNVNEYNVFNQLIRTKSGDTIVTYKYNGEGQRIEKTTQKKGDKKTIRYVRLGNDIALEMDSRGKLLSRNISGTAAISREIDGQKYFLLYNGEGDVTALSDRNGNLVEKYYYDAFGNVLETVDAANQAITPGKSKSTLKYRGYEYDEETKLYYLNCRMYDPAIARFLQEDTYRGQANDPLSLNLYSYCVNNPIRYTDPTGHKIDRREDDGGGSTPGPVAKKKIKAQAESIDTKINTGKITEKDLAKLNNEQLMAVIVRSSSDYNSASTSEKAKLHNLAEAARKELLKDNKGNELIETYVKNANTANLVAVTNKGTIKLDAVTVSKYVENGSSKSIDIITTLKPKDINKVPAKPSDTPDWAANYTISESDKARSNGGVDPFGKESQKKYIKAVDVAVTIDMAVTGFGLIKAVSQKAVIKAFSTTTTKAVSTTVIKSTVAETGIEAIFKNGKVTKESIESNLNWFSGKNADEIAEVLYDQGYDVTIRNSTKSSSGAQIIEIHNTGNGMNISQVQISPGGGRHGASPYIKISTIDQGIFKIVDGSAADYISNAVEKATIFFTGGTK